jgi:hypothetical protein
MFTCKLLDSIKLLLERCLKNSILYIKAALLARWPGCPRRFFLSFDVVSTTCSTPIGAFSIDLLDSSRLTVPLFSLRLLACLALAEPPQEQRRYCHHDALLHLHSRHLHKLERWEALEGKLLTPLPASRPPPPQAPPAELPVRGPVELLPMEVTGELLSALPWSPSPIPTSSIRAEPTIESSLPLSCSVSLCVVRSSPTPPNLLMYHRCA